MRNSSKQIVLFGLLLALCVIGSNFKILGSIALDSFPAFLGTLILGPGAGLILGVLGHLVSAIFAGFPMGIILHLLIGIMMGITMLGYGWVRKRFFISRFVTILLSDVVAYILNVPASLVLLLLVLPKEALIALFLPLTVATIVNLVITEMIYVALPNKVKRVNEIE